MKQLSLLCVLLFVSLTVICQNTSSKASLIPFGNEAKHQGSVSNKGNHLSNPNMPLPKLQSMMMRKDSIIIEIDTSQQLKSLFEYLPNQDIMVGTTTSLDLQAGTVWNNSRRDTFYFDIDGYLIQHTSLNWDDVNSQFVFYEKKTYTYNANHERTQYILNRVVNQLNYNYKEIYTYNAHGDVSIYMTYNWDSNINQWIPLPQSTKYDYFYNINNTLDSCLVSQWDTTLNQWYYTSKDEYSYDANGYLALFVRHGEYVNNQWVFGEKHEYTNDIVGNPVTVIDYDWDTQNLGWKQDTKSFRTYDANNRLILAIYYQFTSISSWVENQKTELTYDMNGNLLSSYVYKWDGVAWFPSFENAYTYNTNYTYNDVYLFRWDSNGRPTDNWINENICTSYRYSEDELGTWEILETQDYYYSLANINSVTTMPSEDINVYPNPTEGILSIDMPFEQGIFEMRDVQGKVVFSQSIVRKEAISLPNVAKGIYIAHLFNGDKSYNFKLMVR